MLVGWQLLTFCISLNNLSSKRRGIRSMNPLADSIVDNYHSRELSQLFLVNVQLLHRPVEPALRDFALSISDLWESIKNLSLDPHSLIVVALSQFLAHSRVCRVAIVEIQNVNSVIFVSHILEHVTLVEEIEFVVSDCKAQQTDNQESFHRVK